MAEKTPTPEPTEPEEPTEPISPAKKLLEELAEKPLGKPEGPLPPSVNPFQRRGKEPTGLGDLSLHEFNVLDDFFNEGVSLSELTEPHPRFPGLSLDALRTLQAEFFDSEKEELQTIRNNKIQGELFDVTPDAKERIRIRQLLDEKRTVGGRKRLEKIRGKLIDDPPAPKPAPEPESKEEEKDILEKETRGVGSRPVFSKEYGAPDADFYASDDRLTTKEVKDSLPKKPIPDPFKDISKIFAPIKEDDIGEVEEEKEDVEGLKPTVRRQMLRILQHFTTDEIDASYRKEYIKGTSGLTDSMMLNAMGKLSTDMVNRSRDKKDFIESIIELGISEDEAEEISDNYDKTAARGNRELEPEQLEKLRDIIDIQTLPESRRRLLEKLEEKPISEEEIKSVERSFKKRGVDISKITRGEMQAEVNKARREQRFGTEARLIEEAKNPTKFKILNEIAKLQVAQGFPLDPLQTIKFEKKLKEAERTRTTEFGIERNINAININKEKRKQDDLRAVILRDEEEIRRVEGKERREFIALGAQKDRDKADRDLLRDREIAENLNRVNKENIQKLKDSQELQERFVNEVFKDNMLKDARIDQMAQAIAENDKDASIRELNQTLKNIMLAEKIRADVVPDQQFRDLYLNRKDREISGRFLPRAIKKLIERSKSINLIPEEEDDLDKFIEEFDNQRITNSDFSFQPKISKKTKEEIEKVQLTFKDEITDMAREKFKTTPENAGDDLIATPDKLEEYTNIKLNIELAMDQEVHRIMIAAIRLEDDDDEKEEDKDLGDTDIEKLDEPLEEKPEKLKAKMNVAIAFQQFLSGLGVRRNILIQNEISSEVALDAEKISNDMNVLFRNAKRNPILANTVEEVRRKFDIGAMSVNEVMDRLKNLVELNKHSRDKLIEPITEEQVAAFSAPTRGKDPEKLQKMFRSLEDKDKRRGLDGKDFKNIEDELKLHGLDIPVGILGKVLADSGDTESEKLTQLRIIVDRFVIAQFKNIKPISEVEGRKVVTRFVGRRVKGSQEIKDPNFREQVFSDHPTKKVNLWITEHGKSTEYHPKSKSNIQKMIKDLTGKKGTLYEMVEGIEKPRKISLNEIKIGGVYVFTPAINVGGGFSDYMNVLVNLLSSKYGTNTRMEVDDGKMEVEPVESKNLSQKSILSSIRKSTQDDDSGAGFSSDSLTSLKNNLSRHGASEEENMNLHHVNEEGEIKKISISEAGDILSSKEPKVFVVEKNTDSDKKEQKKGGFVAWIKKAADGIKSIPKKVIKIASKVLIPKAIDAVVKLSTGGKFVMGVKELDKQMGHGGSFWPLRDKMAWKKNDEAAQYKSYRGNADKIISNASRINKVTIRTIAGKNHPFTHSLQEDYEGGSFWSWIKNSAQSIGKGIVKFGKDTFGTIKNVVKGVEKAGVDVVQLIKHPSGDNFKNALFDIGKSVVSTGKGVLDELGNTVNLVTSAPILKQANALAVAMVPELGLAEGAISIGKAAIEGKFNKAGDIISGLIPSVVGGLAKSGGSLSITEKAQAESEANFNVLRSSIPQKEISLVAPIIRKLGKPKDKQHPGGLAEGKMGLESINEGFAPTEESRTPKMFENNPRATGQKPLVFLQSMKDRRTPFRRNLTPINILSVIPDDRLLNDFRVGSGERVILPQQ